MKAFKIYARKMSQPNQEANTNYNVDHTSLTFLIDSSNQYIDILNPALSEKEGAEWVL
jgi:cytochrome oxidase Cu insertion factor (SCO1/SenC/PrrC family)